MTKLYIGGGSGERDAVREMICQMRGAGFEITHDWTDSQGYDRPFSIAERKAAAMGDLIGVAEADIFWGMIPEKPSEGLAGELVAASIRGCAVFLSGPCVGRSIFHALADWRFASHEECRDYLIDAKARKKAADYFGGCSRDPSAKPLSHLVAGQTKAAPEPAVKTFQRDDGSFVDVVQKLAAQTFTHVRGPRGSGKTREAARWVVDRAQRGEDQSFAVVTDSPERFRAELRKLNNGVSSLGGDDVFGNGATVRYYTSDSYMDRRVSYTARVCEDIHNWLQGNRSAEFSEGGEIVTGRACRATLVTYTGEQPKDCPAYTYRVNQQAPQTDFSLPSDKLAGIPG